MYEHIRPKQGSAGFEPPRGKTLHDGREGSPMPRLIFLLLLAMPALAEGPIEELYRELERCDRLVLRALHPDPLTDKAGPRFRQYLELGRGELRDLGARYLSEALLSGIDSRGEIQQQLSYLNPRHAISVGDYDLIISFESGRGRH